jgi:hypothetical protein
VSSIAQRQSDREQCAETIQHSYSILAEVFEIISRADFPSAAALPLRFISTFLFVSSDQNSLILSPLPPLTADALASAQLSLFSQLFRREWFVGELLLLFSFVCLFVCLFVHSRVIFEEYFSFITLIPFSISDEISRLRFLL